MKLPVILLVNFVAIVAARRKSLSARQLQRQITNGQFNKQALMRAAKPFSPAARKLEEEDAENEEQGDEEFEISGLHSVQFDSCLSLKTQNEDIFDEDMVLYAENGKVVAQQSYITFNVCYTSECSYEAEDDKLTFVTDIASFFQAFVEFLPYQVETYCEGCYENYDYCMGNLEEPEEEGQDDEEDQDEDGPDDEGEGDRRMLAPFLKHEHRLLANNEVVEMIDCDICEAYECFSQEEQENGRRRQEEEEGDDFAEEEYYDFMDSLNWLDEISECKEIEDTYLHYMQVYAGLICNADGTGVEIGVFWDEECQLYVAEASYTNMMTYADSQYYEMSEEIVEFMFTNDFSCYQAETRYSNPYEYNEEEENDRNDSGDGEEEEDEEVAEAADWCDALFNGQMEPISLYDCGQEEDASNEDAEDAAEEDQYDAYLTNYAWYSYDITQEQLEDDSEVCQVIKELEGGYSTVYDSKNSGSMYTYNTKRKSKIFNNDGTSSGMSAGGIATLIFLFIGAAVICGAIIYKQSKPTESDSSRETPLMEKSDGILA